LNDLAFDDNLRSSAVFILSSAHSGSTWIGYVLGSGPESAFLGEYSRAWDDKMRVPCTLCACRGSDVCEVLDGIELRPAEEAFALAAARTKRRVLVDNSKQIGWTRKFLDSGRLDVRVIHVVKDPRSWFASVRRRHGWPIGDAMAIWCRENREIGSLVRATGESGLTVCYDLLASRPRRHFSRLFGFCGLQYSDAALQYWTVEHHGFAANGASDALIRSAASNAVPGHFATGDDMFYQRNSRRLFRDDRWRTELTPEEAAAIRRHPEVRALLSRLGFRMTRSGMRPLPWWSRLGSPRGSPPEAWPPAAG
jgi:hypothetical protein